MIATAILPSETEKANQVQLISQWNNLFFKIGIHSLQFFKYVASYQILVHVQEGFRQRTSEKVTVSENDFGVLLETG